VSTGIVDGGRIFREAWIAGVRKHHPGEVKPGYVAGWEDTPDWERDAASVVYAQIRAFLDVTNGHAAKLSRVQKGQFVAVCWAAQIHRRIPEPKPSYVAEWENLPAWQQETDADIFERIERDHLITTEPTGSSL
jgi:hypothetical protein